MRCTLGAGTRRRNAVASASSDQSPVFHRPYSAKSPVDGRITAIVYDLFLNLTLPLTLCYELTPDMVTNVPLPEQPFQIRGLQMQVLIVESRAELGALWQRHLVRLGATVVLATDQDSAIDHLRDQFFQIIILDLVLADGSALAVADFASYRHPKTRVIFVTNTSFFSDGSIFRHCANACAFMPSATPPADLAAMVEHYAAEDSKQNANG